jgi:hypothetical protein
MGRHSPFFPLDGGRMRRLGARRVPSRSWMGVRFRPVQRLRRHHPLPTSPSFAALSKAAYPSPIKGEGSEMEKK